jgi:hypothetical protein
MRKWNKEELKYIKKNCKKLTAKEIADYLKRSKNSIKMKVWRLKLKLVKGKPRNFNEDNGMWKGDKAKLSAIHLWVKSRKPKPLLCERCKKNKPYDLANISQKYKRDVNDYLWVCRGCHMREDKRIYNLKNQKRFI